MISTLPAYLKDDPHRIGDGCRKNDRDNGWSPPKKVGSHLLRSLPPHLCLSSINIDSENSRETRYGCEDWPGSDMYVSLPTRRAHGVTVNMQSNQWTTQHSAVGPECSKLLKTTELRKFLCTWFGEVCSCCDLSLLPQLACNHSRNHVQRNFLSSVRTSSTQNPIQIRTSKLRIEELWLLRPQFATQEWKRLALILSPYL